jgi:hypothetical protein
MSSQKGYPTQEKDDRLSAQFQTIEPVRELQYGSTVVAHQFVYEVGTDAAEAGSSSSVIVATSHSALKGDVIRLTSGALSGREVKVWEVATNSITLAETLPSAVAAAVTFQILRHKYPVVDSTGAVNITGSISFSEEATAADGGALPALVKVVGGYDGSAVQVIKTDAAGELQVDVLSSALPTGAATEATLATLATEATIATLATEATVATLATEATVSTLATEATVSTLATEATVSQLALESTQTDGTQKTQIVDGSGNVISSTLNALDVNLKSPVVVDVSLSEANDSVAVFGNDGTTNRALKTDAAGELQIDVLSSALPTGAATAVKQPALGTAGTASVDVITVQGIASMTALKVDGSAVTQPISAASLPLPSGASTSAAQTDGTQKAQIVDGSGNVIGSTGNALDVNLKSPIVVDVNLDEADDSVAVFGYDGTVNRAIKTDASGELQVDILSSALPTGAATETTLNAIKTAVELIDNAISGNELQVDVVTSALPAGAATETTLLAIESDTTSLAGCVSGSEIQVDVVSSALPTGAATEATLGDIKTSVQLIDDCVGTDGVAAPTKSFVIAGVTAGGIQQTIEVNASGHVNISDGGGTITVDATSWPLPTGAATETTLVAIEADTTALSGCVAGTEIQVDIVAALPSGTNTIGKVDVNTLSVIDLLDAGILDTSSTNIAGSASSPTQVVASTAAATKKLQLLDTTGAFIGVYTGAALSEVLQFVMGPGSDQTIEHSIPAATRISLKRLDSTSAVSSGIVAINFIG